MYAKIAMSEAEPNGTRFCLAPKLGNKFNGTIQVALHNSTSLSCDATADERTGEHFVDAAT